MCGIVGLFGHVDEEKLELFEELFQINILRGSDSCGIAVMNKESVDVIKDVTWPDELIEKEEYEKATWEKELDNVIGLIGHNRAKTRGEVKKENAHPFQIGNITMVHNGTIWTMKFSHPTKETDSETICDSINKDGIEETWKKVDGAAALAYFDNSTKKFYLIRNDKRPMWFLEWGDKSSTIFFASEPWMIVTAAHRLNIPISVKKLWNTDKDKLYEFEYKDGKVTYTSRELEPYKESYRYSGARGRNAYGQYGMYDEWGWADYEEIDPNEDNNREHDKNCNCSECCARRVAEYHDMVRKKERKEACDNDNNDPFPGEDGYEPVDTSRGSYHRAFSSVRKATLLKVDILHKNIDQQYFNQYYHFCSCCGSPLVGQFKNAIIINHTSHDALCSNCGAVGEYAPAPYSEVAMH